MKSIVFVCVLAVSSAALAQETDRRWFARGYFGLGSAGDVSFDQQNYLADGVTGEGSFGGGFYAGGSLGAQISPKWALELAWDYRSNDHDEVVFSDGTTFTEGNLASSVFVLNGLYTFRKEERRWNPYVGAGLGWVQEIDIDFETDEGEESFSGSGTVWQALGGIEWDINQRWRWFAETRYTTVPGEDLEAEIGPGVLEGIDQTGFSAGIGMTFRF